jgi:hypothetical protein
MSTPPATLPSSDAGSPLKLLCDWHRLGELQFETLESLLAVEPGVPASLQAQAAAYAVTVYFDAAAAVHHVDEELDLFPALIESMAGSDAVCLREMIEWVKQEHRFLESMWRSLRPSMCTLAAGRPARLDPAGVASLIHSCGRAFKREELELFPMAERLLSDESVEAIRIAIDTRHRIFKAHQ